MTTNLADARTKMTTIRASLKREVDAINASPRFTDTGRRQELAKTVLAHRKQAKALRDGCTISNDDSRAKLTQKLFGMPANADGTQMLVYRDAIDRAEQLRSPEQLDRALTRAVAMGDNLLARAVAGRAHELGVRSVAEKYAETAGLDHDFDELNALPSSQLVSTATFGLPMPTELRGILGGVSDDQLQRIADGDDQ